MEILIIMLFPILASIILFILKSKMLNRLVILFYSVLFLCCTISLQISPKQLLAYFRVDDLNILFLIILAVVNFCVSIYNLGYSKHGDRSDHWDTYYSIFLLIFIVSMTGVLLSTHLGILWVFIEATTLSSGPLIYFSRTKASLEATWLYVFICSIGISLTFVGITLLMIGSIQINSLFIDDLYNSASKISPFWLKLSFPFVLFGFGTKAGLAPVHVWLPDAHSEAPSPISALLSGTLLNTALLGILRFYKLLDLANLTYIAQVLLIIMGMLSILIGAVFISKIDNFKRMLAYSSIENMGIIIIGIGIGGFGIFAGLLHMIAHSLTKASFFLTAGNILIKYNTSNIYKISGLFKLDKVSGWLWILGFLGISAIPPFPAFISELFLIKEMIFKEYYYILIPFMILLTIIMYAMGKRVIKMIYGTPTSEHITEHKLSLAYYLPQMILIIILVILGIYIPEYLYDIIQKASNSLLKNGLMLSI